MLKILSFRTTHPQYCMPSRAPAMSSICKLKTCGHFMKGPNSILPLKAVRQKRNSISSIDASFVKAPIVLYFSRGRTLRTRNRNTRLFLIWKDLEKSVTGKLLALVFSYTRRICTRRRKTLLRSALVCINVETRLQKCPNVLRFSAK